MLATARAVAPGDEKVCPTCGGSGHVTQVKRQDDAAFRLHARAAAVKESCAQSAATAAVKDAFSAWRRLTSASRRARRRDRACASQGAGNAGSQSGAPGDLYIIMKASRTRSSIGVATTCTTVVPITVMEASLGAKVEVPTIDGRSQGADPTRYGQREKAPSPRERCAIRASCRQAWRSDHRSSDRGS